VRDGVDTPRTLINANELAARLAEGSWSIMTSMITPLKRLRETPEVEE
jgi:hypothetical protein